MGFSDLTGYWNGVAKPSRSWRNLGNGGGRERRSTTREFDVVRFIVRFVFFRFVLLWRSIFVLWNHSDFGGIFAQTRPAFCSQKSEFVPSPVEPPANENNNNNEDSTQETVARNVITTVETKSVRVEVSVLTRIQILIFESVNGRLNPIFLSNLD